MIGEEPRHKVQEDKEAFEDAPVWWKVEVEGHSINPRNRNRVRKFLRKKLDYLARRTDLPEGVNRDDLRQREAQLAYYQRPPRPKKQTPAGHLKKHQTQQANTGTDR